MGNTTERVIEALAGLKRMSPSGFAIAADIKFTTPTFLFQTYSQDWLEEYSSEGMVMRDPTVAWGLSNEGTKCWSELHDADAGFFRAAQRHGLTFGFTISTHETPLRSIASFARSDQNFTDAEVEQIEAHYRTLLDLLKRAQDTSQSEVDDIVAISQGLTH